MPRILRAPIPATRDPFINTPLIRLSPDPKTGADRFWISTWNSNRGSTAALVDEFGASRIFRFKAPHWGFYSAIQSDDDTLWLCGSLGKVVRFSLAGGKYEDYDTGFGWSLVFQGMTYDKPTGKLMAATFDASKMATLAFVFDTRSRKVLSTHQLPTAGHYSRFTFPNGDGTHSLLLHLPGDHLVRWDPRRDTFNETVIEKAIDSEATEATTYSLVADDKGRRYFPGRGWFNPATPAFDADGPRPKREMTWFGHHGNSYVGCTWNSQGVKIGAWDAATGKVRDVCSIPDATAHSVNVTASGRVISVNTYGIFHRHDLKTGALECSRVLASDNVGSIDCLTRLDKTTVLGTPFITQRFWTLSLKTKRGVDEGRAAPGVGEIMRLCRANGGKVYMAAYTGAELMEFDPMKPARFPENPRVVAVAPGGLRPVAIATDGRVIWYACSVRYGHLGSVITRYDTKTGMASSAVNPLGDFQMQSVVLDKKSRTLLVGSTIHADCNSATPTQKVGTLARLDADTLKVLAKRPAPDDSPDVHVLGPVAPGKWLAAVTVNGKRHTRTLDNDLNHIDAAAHPLPVGHRVLYSGKPGRFVIPHGKQFDLWDFRKGAPKLERLLAQGDWQVCHVDVEDGSILFNTPWEVIVLDGVLK